MQAHTVSRPVRPRPPAALGRQGDRESGADAVVLDLEDSVPSGDRKAAARETVAASIARRARDATPTWACSSGSTRSRRGSPEPTSRRSSCPASTGVFAPKIEQATDVLQYDALLDHFEARNGVTGLEYIVPVETVQASRTAREIASASPRVGAMIGPTRRARRHRRAVGYEWTPEGLETLYLRSQVLLACREAGIHALTGLWEDLENLDGLREFAVRGRQLGFRGMIAIHPSHVADGQRGVHPVGRDDGRSTEGMVAAYDEAAAAGDGALRYRGLHIDKAHVRQGRRVAGACGPAARDRRRRRRDRDVDDCSEACTSRSSRSARTTSTRCTRTVTEMDNVLFTSLTMNRAAAPPRRGVLQGDDPRAAARQQPVHRRAHRRLAIVPELTMGTTLGNLGYDEDQVPQPGLPRRHAARRDDDRRQARVHQPDRLGDRLVRARRASTSATRSSSTWSGSASWRDGRPPSPKRPRRKEIRIHDHYHDRPAPPARLGSRDPDPAHRR